MLLSPLGERRQSPPFDATNPASYWNSSRCFSCCQGAQRHNRRMLCQQARGKLLGCGQDHAHSGLMSCAGHHRADTQPHLHAGARIHHSPAAVAGRAAAVSPRPLSHRAEAQLSPLGLESCRSAATSRSSSGASNCPRSASTTSPATAGTSPQPPTPTTSAPSP
jgi:hypothetical protein